MYLKTASNTWVNTRFIVLLTWGASAADSTKFAVKAVLSVETSAGFNSVELKGVYDTEDDAMHAAERVTQGFDPSVYAS